MSGHSHWSSIKHQKGAADAKRGKIFSKVSRQIIIAAKEGDKDPELNPRLKMAIEQAKVFNMPKENIERAIKKGAGELTGEKFEPVLFEAVGPNNGAIIIEGITDNKNRSISEIRQILNTHNAKLVDEGAVKWLFDKKGVILIKKSGEEEELKIIEAGAEDVRTDEEYFEIFTKPENLETVKKNLIEAGFEIESFSLGYRAKETIEAGESYKKLFEALDENDAVQEIYSNIEI